MEDSVSTLLRHDLFIKFVAASITLSIIAMVIRLLHNYYEWRTEDVAVRYRKHKILSFFGMLAVLFSLAFIFNERLGGLIPAIGILGAGVAFALQEVIASIAGWLAIAFTNFYRVGDRVQLGGIKGDVIDIGTLRTTMMEIGEWVGADLYSGRIVRVANSFIFKEPVYNYSADFPFVWDEIMIPITYVSDLEFTRKTLLRVADETVGDYISIAREHWRKMEQIYILDPTSLEPRVFIVLTDNWIECSLRYVVDYKRRRGIKDIIFTRLLEEIRNNGDRIQIATSSFQISEIPDLSLRVRRGKQ